MTLAKIKQGALIPYYTVLDNSLGFYQILPGFPSFICLNQNLLEGPQEDHLFVYQTLVEYHQSIPADSKKRVFKQTRYFEELRTLPLPEPEVVIIGRAMRLWRFSFDEGRVRTIGKAG